MDYDTAARRTSLLAQDVASNLGLKAVMRSAKKPKGGPGSPYSITWGVAPTAASARGKNAFLIRGAGTQGGRMEIEAFTVKKGRRRVFLADPRNMEKAVMQARPHWFKGDHCRPVSDGKCRVFLVF